ncbi:MAG: cbb3-type cytochrome oxidase assembly protein CcoS [Bacteroidetes bacterium]|nr:cbb3-type cytochrome oxidase assembly protein CcoS [Bacteroidota bacterium]
MSVILVLVAFSIIVALVFLILFFWSVRSGQYDDPYSSSVRILFDDEKPKEENPENSGKSHALPEQPSNQ